MNQSNKALRDLVAEGIAETFALDMENKRGIEYAAAYQEADNAIALVTNHIKGALPKKYINWKDVPDKLFNLASYRHKSEYRRGYNQALDDVNKVLEENSNEK